MDYYRHKYRAELIDIKTFDRCIEVINYLEDKGYTFKEVFGDGAYGSVIKVKQATTGVELAAKIVHKDYVSDDEVNLWKKLNHGHILDEGASSSADVSNIAIS